MASPVPTPNEARDSADWLWTRPIPMLLAVAAWSAAIFFAPREWWQRIGVEAETARAVSVLGGSLLGFIVVFRALAWLLAIARHAKTNTLESPLAVYERLDTQQRYFLATYRIAGRDAVRVPPGAEMLVRTLVAADLLLPMDFDGMSRLTDRAVEVVSDDSVGKRMDADFPELHTQA